MADQQGGRSDRGDSAFPAITAIGKGYHAYVDSPRLRDIDRSALNFELRAWTDHFEEWVSIRSEMAVAVEQPVKPEGIEIRFPQRHVTLHFRPREET